MRFEQKQKGEKKTNNKDYRFKRWARWAHETVEVQWMEEKGGQLTFTQHRLIYQSNPPAPNSLIRSLEQNADLHIIIDYAQEDNNNSFGVLK